jgi:hypothetical protein
VLAPVQFTKYIAESAMISLDPMNQALLKHPKVSHSVQACLCDIVKELLNSITEVCNFHLTNSG